MSPVESAALEASVKTAEGFFSRIFGPAADQIGLIRSDNMNVRRLKNQIRLLGKVRKIVEKEEITLKQVNLKALFPLLEGIALEEDGNIQEMWANLFTNYIDAKSILTAHVYPDILRQLSTEEVEILTQMQSNSNRIRILSRSLHGEIQEPFAYLDQITNLERLGIVTGIPRFKTEGQGDGLFQGLSQIGKRGSSIQQLTPETYTITDFGIQFLQACTRERN